MLTLSNVKDQIKSLSESENYFLLSELEPKHQNNFMEVSFKANEDNFEILDLAESIDEDSIYKTIKYEDVEVLDVDNILVSIELKGGIIYFCHEQRDNLAEILKDFNDDICITKYKVIEEDGETKYKIEHYFIMEDYEIIEDEDENTVGIKNESGNYVFDYNDIRNIQEEYYGGDSSNGRDVRVYLGDEAYVVIESM